MDDKVEIPTNVNKNTFLENEALGISEKYDRRLYEDTNKLKAYKNDIYGGKKTKTSVYTGRKMHKDSKAAKKLYGQNAKYHASDTDHKISLKEMHGIAQKNPLYKNNLKDSDLREIGNAKGSSFREIPQIINRGKGSQNDIAYALSVKKATKKTPQLQKIEFKNQLTPEGRVRFVSEYIVRRCEIEQAMTTRSLKNRIQHEMNQLSQIRTNTRNEIRKTIEYASPENVAKTYNTVKANIEINLSQRVQATTTQAINKAGAIAKLEPKKTAAMAKNVGKATGHAVHQGVSAALMTLTVSGLNNLALVAAGEKDIEEAMKDTLSDTSGTLITVVGLDLVQETIKGIAKAGGNKELAGIMGNGIPIAEISAVIMTASSVIRYINGESTTEECVTEILMNGAGVVAYSLGMAIGGPAGAVVANIVMAQISRGLVEYKMSKKLSEEKLAKINNTIADALIEMEYQRKTLKELISTKYAAWDEEFDKGFEKICVATLQSDFEGISRGIDTILNVFDKTVFFRTVEEFDEFFYDEDAVLVL